MLVFKELIDCLFFPYIRGDNLATTNSYNKYFLPRIKINNYNIEIDGRNFYNQPINDSIKQYHEKNSKNEFKNDLPNELLLPTRQKTKFRNASNNNISTDLKLSKAQISKIIESGGFLGSLLSKSAGPLMKGAIILAKIVLEPLGITAAASTIDAEIQKKYMVL